MLTHLEYEQIKRALERLRGDGSGNNSYNSNLSIKREDVIEIILPYVEGFTPPNPHPKVEPPGYPVPQSA